MTIRAESPARGSMRGPNGVAACDHPLAASAGLSTLLRGGSAADAAIAMGAVMTVVQPHYSHLGGDVFAVTFDAASGKVDALNSSGPAPRSANADDYRALGSIPDSGPLAVTIPGAVGGWWALHQAQGRLPWKDLFDAAIGYARDGFPASRTLAGMMAVGRRRMYPAGAFKQTFGGISDDGGQGLRQPALARAYELIAAGGQDAFYSGEIRDACLAALNSRGGSFAAEEWVSPASWETPLSAGFEGATVHTQPPPSHGFVLPLALRLYAAGLREEPSLNPLIHQYHALKHAFALRHELAGDPRVTGFDAAALVAQPPVPRPSRQDAPPQSGDTTYIIAIDGEGNAVSLIQSVYFPWGAATLIPEFGIFMNNRMSGFSLRPGHPNELAPGKRPVHTLHSYIVTVEPPPLLPLQEKMGETRAAALVAVGGTPGAMQQPQTNLQVLDGLLRLGLDPQDALDLGRWSLDSFGSGPKPENHVSVESREPDHAGDVFRAAGFEVETLPSWDSHMGRAYLAARGPAGWSAAADLRGEGVALVY